MSPEERERALRLARRTLIASSRHEPLPAPADALAEGALAEGTLAEPRACFVTLRLREGGALRGCIGTLEPHAPLAETIVQMTHAAAMRDSRFRSVEAWEPPGLRIEISVLTPSVPLEDPRALIVGEHGLVVRYGERRGLLLPQVAQEQGWDRETFLAETCRKAGLDPQRWRDPETKIEVFRAECFGEEAGPRA
ncbi:MAG: AmmeMemoRadiSam system protein A [Myxococcales bacterium]|nr:AmmeMemoRadiSam system protein A [Myxococcales bacterium]